MILGRVFRCYSACSADLMLLVACYDILIVQGIFGSKNPERSRFIVWSCSVRHLRVSMVKIFLLTLYSTRSILDSSMV